MGSGWFLFIVLGISAISWIIGKVKEQQELKEARERMRQRQMEMARSGTQVSTPAPSRADTAAGGAGTQDYLEQARRERMEALRRKRAQETGRRAEVDDDGGVVVGPRGGEAGPPSGPELITEEDRRRNEMLLRQRERQIMAQREAAEAELERRRKVSAQARARAKQAEQRRAGMAGAGGVRRAREERDTRRVSVREEEARAARAKERITPKAVVVPAATVAEGIRTMMVRSDGDMRRAHLMTAVAMMEVFNPPVSQRAEETLPWNRGL